MKKAHLNKWRKELSKGGSTQGCMDTGRRHESYPRNCANGYHYVLNIIPISPAHGGGNTSNHLHRLFTEINEKCYSV